MKFLATLFITAIAISLNDILRNGFTPMNVIFTVEMSILAFVAVYFGTRK